MKLIIPAYVVSIGNFLIGMFVLGLGLADHKTTIYGAIFSTVGITGCLIVISLRSLQKRIEKIESHNERG